MVLAWALLAGDQAIGPWQPSHAGPVPGHPDVAAVAAADGRLPVRRGPADRDPASCRCRTRSRSERISKTSPHARSSGERSAGRGRRLRGQARHILYVEGYDPRGAEGYFDLFARTCERFQRVWQTSVALGPLEIDSPDFAHWRIELRGAQWRTETRYEFLRLERFIRADMEQPGARQLLRGLAWCATDIASGALFRIFRASALRTHLLYFHVLLIAWLAAALAVAFALDRTLAAPLVCNSQC